MRFSSLFGAMMACVLAVGPASAAITTYSNTQSSATNYDTNLTAIRNLWEAGVSGLQNVTFGVNGASQFNANATVINSSNAISNAFTDCSLAASNLGASQVCIERRNSGTRTWIEVDIPPVAWGNRFFRGDQGTSDGIAIALTPGTRAFALDLYTLFGTGSISVSMYDSSGLAGDISVGSTNDGVPAYLGVTSDTVLTSLIVTSSTRGIGIDTISFANALAGQGGGEPLPNTDAPESATLGYIGMGLLALLAGRKRARR